MAVRWFSRPLGRAALRYCEQPRESNGDGASPANLPMLQVRVEEVIAAVVDCAPRRIRQYEHCAQLRIRMSCVQVKRGDGEPGRSHFGPVSRGVQ
jgi:hypothetical protein